MYARLKKPVMIAVPALLMVTAFQNCSPNPDVPIYKTTEQSSTTNPASTSTSDDPTGATKQCRFFLTSGNSWTVPSDFNSANNSIEAIGNGSDGGGNTRAGGGGGAYSKSVNVALNPGAIVSYSVAHTAMYWPGDSTAGHTTAINSGDSWFCNSSANCASMAGAAVVVGAAGGKSSTNGPYGANSIDGQGGVGGAAALGVAMGVGSLKYSGGNGGNCKNYDCTYNPATEPGSGGGAAGPHGNGMPGGPGMGMGGAGDAGYGGSGGGINQRGGNGTTWDATHGSGGGGGGSQQFTAGGNGGNYGGGGGGGGNDGMRAPAVASSVGGGGIIVVTYMGTKCM